MLAVGHHSIVVAALLVAKPEQWSRRTGGERSFCLDRDSHQCAHACDDAAAKIARGRLRTIAAGFRPVMKSATCLDLTEVGVRILQSVQILSTHTLTIFHPEKWRLHIPPISTACRNPREPKTASLSKSPGVSV